MADDHHSGEAERLSRAARRAANQAAWALREPPPRKGALTRAEASALRKEAWRLGRQIGADDGSGLPDPNAEFLRHLKIPPFPWEQSADVDSGEDC